MVLCQADAVSHTDLGTIYLSTYLSIYLRTQLQIHTWIIKAQYTFCMHWNRPRPYREEPQPRKA